MIALKTDSNIPNLIICTDIQVGMGSGFCFSRKRLGTRGPIGLEGPALQVKVGRNIKRQVVQIMPIVVAYVLVKRIVNTSDRKSVV